MFDVLPVPMQPSTVGVVTGSRSPPKGIKMREMRGIGARSARQTASRMYIRFIIFYSSESTRIGLSNELYYSSVTPKLIVVI